MAKAAELLVGDKVTLIVKSEGEVKGIVIKNDHPLVHVMVDKSDGAVIRILAYRNIEDVVIHSRGIEFTIPEHLRVKDEESSDTEEDSLEERCSALINERMRKRGFKVHTKDGATHLRIDSREDLEEIAGILCDTVREVIEGDTPTEDFEEDLPHDMLDEFKEMESILNRPPRDYIVHHMKSRTEGPARETYVSDVTFIRTDEDGDLIMFDKRGDLVLLIPNGLLVAIVAQELVEETAETEGRT